MLSLQLKRLLLGVAASGDQHLAEIKTDLTQTNFLLAEAIGKLGADFMAIHEAISAQQEIIGKLQAGPVLTDADVADLNQISAEIGVRVGSVVTGLQFQDMTNQLLDRALQRVAGLSEVLETLDTSGAGIARETATEEIVALLEGVNRLLEERNEKLESNLWKAVCQTHMGSGDVELF
ncbi:MAG: chemotaxis protein [Burkholderiaceae bacterium]